MMIADPDYKVSIITVCYNEPQENVQRTFDSICAQTHLNIEWIVVDGGSRQETLAAINGYRSRINSFISEPDNGIYDAMNKGLALASGDFVMFMNTGDWFYSENTLRKIGEFIQANPRYDCYYGDVVVADGDGNKWAAPLITKINRYNLRYSMICHQAIISRKAVFESTENSICGTRLLPIRIGC